MIATRRHAESVKDEPWFTSKPWLIAGTGKSLNSIRPFPSIQNNFNILAINSASDILIADLYFCLDEATWADRPNNDFRYVVTRTNNRHDYPENTLYIAIYNNPQIEGYEGYPSQPSSTHAVDYLARTGIKTIHTIGIDGGIGETAEGLNDNYRHYHATYKTNFDDENRIMFSKAKQLGVELIRL